MSDKEETDSLSANDSDAPDVDPETSTTMKMETDSLSANESSDSDSEE